MKFTEAPIKGAYIIDVHRIGDERGYFGRLWCQKEFEDMGLKANISQSNIGVSKQAGTLRGLHYQTAPHQEVKIVRCSRGAMFDVILDLRPDSPTYKQWFGMELNEDNATMLYVPEGCATGYLTLVDNTEMYYHATEFYHPESATGVRYNDPAFSIEWPGDINVLSDNDKNWPDYTG
jgi:dTDP-4-dehydrorhamnose 3,5-epimerase